MEVNPDFSDLLSAFSGEGVEFLIVGGYAVAAYGHVRATKDIDVFVRPSPENARRVFAALRAFGAPLRGVSEADFATPGTIFQIGVAPIRIDIINDISGVAFEQAWSTRTVRRIGSLELPVPSVESLRANKVASGRPQDLADVKALDELTRATGSDAPATATTRRAPKRGAGPKASRTKRRPH